MFMKINNNKMNIIKYHKTNNTKHERKRNWFLRKPSMRKQYFVAFNLLASEGPCK